MNRPGAGSPYPSILFAASEAHPLIKTGGLGDVCGALPPALAALGCDMRLVLPAYGVATKNIGPLNSVADVAIENGRTVKILEGMLPGGGVKCWLVDAPEYFDRPGNPYVGPDGKDWPDNAERYALFARVVAAIALGQTAINWRPDIVHCNDWQTGLVPALLSLHEHRPATLFTIHNLSYQGLFPAETFQRLGLPAELWSIHGLEFYDRLSFIKGGLAYADRLTTVSPTYAKEICTPELGYGLDGLLGERSARLTGILNGVDYGVWDPGVDSHITRHYGIKTLENKAANKTALQKHLLLAVNKDVPLLALISRLVEQKGIDLLLEIVPELMKEDAQLVILGSGEKHYEQALQAILRHHYPQKLAVHIGYDEPLSHQIEAGADVFLMPSRFEPCGLNQIYSLRYGTVPVVRRTGGLADTVIDANDANLAQGTATGFVFGEATPQALLHTIRRALALYRQPAVWRKLMVTGMSQDYSWQHSAKDYLRLYQETLATSLK